MREDVSGVSEVAAEEPNGDKVVEIKSPCATWDQGKSGKGSALRRRGSRLDGDAAKMVGDLRSKAQVVLPSTVAPSGAQSHPRTLPTFQRHPYYPLSVGSGCCNPEISNLMGGSCKDG